MKAKFLNLLIQSTSLLLSSSLIFLRYEELELELELELMWSHMDRSYEETLPEAQITESRGKNKIKTTKRSSKPRKKSNKLINNENEAMEDEEEDQEGEASGLKKLDHNAKERIRRMKLNASYLALRALLPDSRRSKKKWSAPSIVDRVLKYIPELENEVEALRFDKENHVQSQAKTSSTSAKYQIPAISLTKINRDEAVFQVCVGREDDSKFTRLLQSVEEEEEGISIKSASALYVSETRICHHLHIQINNNASEADNNQFEELGDKLISWLS